MMFLYALPCKATYKTGPERASPFRAAVLHFWSHHLMELLKKSRNAMSKGRLRESEGNVPSVNAQTRFGGKNFLLVYNSCCLVLRDANKDEIN